MPKTKLQKPRVAHEDLGLLLGGVCFQRDLSAAEVGRILGCCETTARSRLRHPGDLTVDELTRLARRLEIPIDKLRAAISYQ